MPLDTIERPQTAVPARRLPAPSFGHIGDVASYFYGATGDRALKLKAGFALQWWIVNWLRERGVNWYDLGGAAREPGLRQFKEGLVGKAGRVAVIPGEYTLCESR